MTIQTGEEKLGQSDRLEALRIKLKGQVEAARKRFDELEDDIEIVRQRDEKALADKRDEIEKRVEAQHERFQELREGLAQWHREKVDESKEAIASWRQRRELEKLHKRADRAEESAVNAIYIAMLDADAAEQAVLEALSARIDSDNAAAAS